MHWLVSMIKKAPKITLANNKYEVLAISGIVPAVVVINERNGYEF